MQKHFDDQVSISMRRKVIGTIVISVGVFSIYKNDIGPTYCFEIQDDKSY